MSCKYARTCSNISKPPTVVNNAVRPTLNQTQFGCIPLDLLFRKWLVMVGLLGLDYYWLFFFCESFGSVSKPCTPGEHQNSWDLWMFIPLKMVLIGIDPYPFLCIRSSDGAAALRRFPLPSSVNAGHETYGGHRENANGALANEQNNFQHWRTHFGMENIMHMYIYIYNNIYIDIDIDIDI